jgi:RNA-directed DNA polymerase
MASITRYVEQRLELRVNRDESAVDRATRRPLLGFAFFVGDGRVKVRFDPKARQRAKDRIRQLTARNWGVSMDRRIRELNRFTVGWTNYFALADYRRLRDATRTAGCGPARPVVWEGPG